MTPQLQHFSPHLMGSAKWLGSKFLVVMGSLSLNGATKSKKTWTRLAESTQAGATELTLLDATPFKSGDTIVIQQGLETRKISSVSGNKITLSEELKNSYK